MAEQKTTGRLQDKVALVMGAGSSGPGWGNGKATAVSFARAGAKVVCVDLVAASAEETAGIITAEGGDAVSRTCDVTDSAAIKAVVDDTVARWGRIDILQNVVGIAKMGGPIELDEAEWRQVMDVNLTSVFLACKHVLPVMLAQHKGAIVNISSVAAIRWVGYPYASYYASKGGLNQFTCGLALQYAAQGIRANVIMPGLMDTPLIRTQIAGQYDDVETMIRERDAKSPTGKMGDAWDVANAAVFLASDESKYINGVCLPVDGGHHLKIG
ncbi:dehydrogenase [alpha proteobacterium BAL199]|jgi:NAD(P)-dependent dehydrogenase (short-subunit alcohol dehydrogenase family)|nr:dehydrogenase [alpha proteobacterium BAL199]